MLREGTPRLAAVWFADIVGYSSLSAENADAALGVVAVLQSTARDAAAAHGGRVVKFVGDAALCVFDSLDGALRAALDVQAAFNASAAAMDAGSALRIGLHLGEVTEAADGDVYGDGVNIAARLQPKARPGQVVVSRAVKEMVRGRGGYTVRWLPAWHVLKGLGLASVFVVEPTGGAVPPPMRHTSTRAVAVGLTTAIVGFLTLMMAIAMNPELGDGSGERALAPEKLRDGTVLLDAGIDRYFAGELKEAVASLESFMKPPLRNHPDAQDALRFLSRAQLQSGRADLARAALVQLFNAQPPLALLVPSAEDPALMALYQDVRRDDLMRRTVIPPAAPVDGVVVFDLEVVLPDEADEVLETLGPSVAQMLTSELEAGGIAAQYFWALMVGFTGEGAYARFRDETGGSGEPGASHALLGRIAVRDEQVSLTAQVYDVASGALTATERATGAWPDGLFELVERLGARLSVGLRPVSP